MDFLALVSIEVDAASHTGVDNIRELREKAIIAPTQGKYKVYIATAPTATGAPALPATDTRKKKSPSACPL